MRPWLQSVLYGILTLSSCRAKAASEAALPPKVNSDHPAIGCWALDAHLVDSTYLQELAHFRLDTLLEYQDSAPPSGSRAELFTRYRLVPGEGTRFGLSAPRFAGWTTWGDSIRFGWGDGFNGYDFRAVVARDSLIGVGHWTTDYGPPGPFVAISGLRSECPSGQGTG